MDKNRNSKNFVSTTDVVELNSDKEIFLHVCTSCRPSGCPREPKENRPGYRLYKNIEAKLGSRNLEKKLHLLPAECLSLCSRSCGIAMSSGGSWTYLFGDQDPDTTVDDILECVGTYIKNDLGNMTRNQRPPTLRSSILGRIPPGIKK